MNKYDKSGKLTARDISGYATELAVWHFIRDVAALLSQLHGSGKAHGNVTLDSVSMEGSTFALGKGHNATSIADDVWDFGACIFELITGNRPFGGKGKAGQTPHSPLPSFCESKASGSLSSLMQQCLSFDSDKRPSSETILHVAQQETDKLEKYYADIENLKYKKPQNQKIRTRNYDFWPEAMVSILLLIMLSLPQISRAQTTDSEMNELIRLTTSLRNQNKRAEVLKKLLNDPKWTLMDEIYRHDSECSAIRKDKVKMFGILGIAYEIAQRERGNINVGGSFRNSADGKHQYSFTERTAKAGKTISYRVYRHKGRQQVAVIPFDPSQKYEASFFCGGIEIKPEARKSGATYFSFDVGQNSYYEFFISNNGTSNASFAIITYNSGK